MPIPKEFRDLTFLTFILKTAIGAYLVIAVIGLWSGWLELDLLGRVARGAVVSDAEAAANDSRQAVVGILYLIVFVVTGFPFLRWTYFSNQNAQFLTSDDLEFTPGWAVGWYFIPIMNLWKPYQALKETFKASNPDSAEDWRYAAHPEIMPLWWTLWILSGFLGRAVWSASLNAETLDELINLSWLTLVSDFLDLSLGIVLFLLVSRLQPWQSGKVAQVSPLAI